MLSVLDLFTDDAAFGPDIRLLVAQLTDEETTSLLHACDCFASLHRSEDFGLGPAASHLQRIAGDPALATRLGEQGMITTTSRYSVDAVGRAIATHLEELHGR